MRSTGAKWIREHQNLAFALTILVAIAVTGALSVGLAHRSTARTAGTLTVHGLHDESAGPAIDLPPDANAGITRPGPDGRPGLQPATGANPSPDSASAAPGQPVVSTTPLPPGANEPSFGSERKDGQPTTAVALPSSLTPPAGSEIVHDPSRYSNGVVEWVYVNRSTSYTDLLAAMQARASRNGWRITAEEAPITTDGPTGATIQSKKFFLVNGPMRGFMVVSSGVSGSGSQVQIDLAGV